MGTKASGRKSLRGRWSRKINTRPKNEGQPEELPMPDLSEHFFNCKMQSTKFQFDRRLKPGKPLSVWEAFDIITAVSVGEEELKEKQESLERKFGVSGFLLKKFRSLKQEIINHWAFFTSCCGEAQPDRNSKDASRKKKKTLAVGGGQGNSQNYRKRTQQPTTSSMNTIGSRRLKISSHPEEVITSRMMRAARRAYLLYPDQFKTRNWGNRRKKHVRQLNVKVEVIDSSSDSSSSTNSSSEDESYLEVHVRAAASSISALPNSPNKTTNGYLAGNENSSTRTGGNCNKSQVNVAVVVIEPIPSANPRLPSPADPAIQGALSDSGDSTTNGCVVENEDSSDGTDGSSDNSGVGVGDVGEAIASANPSFCDPDVEGAAVGNGSPIQNASSSEISSHSIDQDGRGVEDRNNNPNEAPPPNLDVYSSEELAQIIANYSISSDVSLNLDFFGEDFVQDVQNFVQAEMAKPNKGVFSVL